MLDLEPHILAILGAATAMIGVGVIVWGASALSSSRSSGRSESLLAPTLAIDMLDPDLRVAYMRTLVLDARVQSKHGSGLREHWGDLGRELRRSLVHEQARRTAGSPAEQGTTFEELIDQALSSLETDEPFGSEWSRLVEESIGLREP